MVSVCEICDNIAKETERKELEKIEAKIKLAQSTIKFCEEIISPILKLNMKEKRFEFPMLFYKGFDDTICPTELGDWVEGITNRGYKKRERHTKDLGLGRLDKQVLIDYLNQFGFEVELRSDYVLTCDYYGSGRPGGYTTFYNMYISINCPME